MKDSREFSRILVVEDELLVGLAIKDMLKEAGYLAEGPVAAPEEVRSLVAALKPHVVIMDLNLGGHFEGIDLGRELIQQGIPVIFITGYANEPILQKVKALSPRGLLIKPLTPQQVLHAVEAVKTGI
ncbi:response regulator receiver [Spirochaeta thermophila DSM 6578]|uniref:Response regulator receiver n=1 Tax=Winmispira thermophila (strain ATCC 700085 / DSM 6578 / Z-1203) TaxID=869211 RepID=G0GAQ1_WINT7|nr:response regulator [Spirochaeta thermophila]AEJ61016.1 response regulator receiver [Spirochaeta thermophila DSM 6578]